MASYHPPPPASAPRPAAHPSAPIASSNTHPGTFVHGTKVQVGSHRVVVEKYLSEGGFAHVYVVNVPVANGKTQQAVLKRVAVPDKESLANMRTEVETMKKLKGHKNIVTYIDSHASQLKGGGYEVFLLMEYCAGGGLIDFMNTRLKNRLTEPEILKIFSDAAEGVACMHYLKPPLLHRDLKVENILISKTSSSTTYKLCDFGSTAPPRPAATSAAEGRLIEEDVQRHTTLQYRSPEMIDVYLKKPIDEKSDIWALGVLLYKLCYYTTPFEQQGQMAIMNASYKYPAYPVFSDKLKLLIATMLTADPRRRPNIYEILKKVCEMRGKPVPLKDIYAQRTHSEVRNNQQLPPREPNVTSPPMVGATVGAPDEIKTHIPEIKPMRRGRPTSSENDTAKKPTPSPGRTIGDPFAALDSSSYDTRSAAVDQLSAKYPEVEQFSILADKHKSFDFNSSSPRNGSPQNLNQKLTQALADDAFASSRSSNPEMPPQKPPRNIPKSGATVSSKLQTPDVPTIKNVQKPPIHQPTPQSTAAAAKGVTTSQQSFLGQPESKALNVNNRPIWRVPPPSQSPSFPERFDSIPPHRTLLRDEPTRSSSHQDTTRGERPIRSPVSSRPSLESLRPPGEVNESLHRSKSTEARPRMSTNDREEALLPLQDQHALKHHHHSLRLPHRSNRHARPLEDKSRVATDPPAVQHNDSQDDDFAIESSVEYLRKVEEEDAARAHHRRTSSTLKHIKHASMPSVSLSGTKNSILGGRFGDAFRRFETNQQTRPISPDSHTRDNDSDTLTPTSTAAYVDEPLKYEDMNLENMDDLSPEVRREIERRRLSQEERRVADGAAAYRERIANNEGGRQNGQSSRATAIQNRVQSLLDESERASATKKTAEGYGKYTDGAKSAPPNVPSKSKTLPDALVPKESSPNPTQRLPARPAAPPKPVSLRTGGPTPISATSGGASPRADDLEADFSRRYPSISLDMVETEITKAERRPQRPMGRVKDV